MDKIIIEKAAFLCRIGVPEEEREDRQVIFISLEMELDTRKAGKEDNIEHSIDYSDVHKLMKAVCEKTFRTIEALAEVIAQEILDKCYYMKLNHKVRVKVMKRDALQDTEYAAVEITRANRTDDI